MVRSRVIVKDSGSNSASRRICDADLKISGEKQKKSLTAPTYAYMLALHRIQDVASNVDAGRCVIQAESSSVRVVPISGKMQGSDKGPSICRKPEYKVIS